MQFPDFTMDNAELDSFTVGVVGDGAMNLHIRSSKLGEARGDRGGGVVDMTDVTHRLHVGWNGVTGEVEGKGVGRRAGPY